MPRTTLAALTSLLLVACGGGRDDRGPTTLFDAGGPGARDAGPGAMACGRDTCSGCCSGTTCLAGTSNTACNTGGNACVDCGPTGLCSAGVCALDPASRWDVIAIDTTYPTTNLSGEAWDAFGGAPDPFIEARAGSDTAPSLRTTPASDVFSASFNQIVVDNARADALRALLRFDAWDLDTAAHDWVGACALASLEDAVFDGPVQTLTCPADASTGSSGFTLRFQVRRH